MTKPSTSAQNGTAKQPSEARERIRACSIALSSGSSQLGNLEWSELGQALVVTDDAIVVLSPLTGLHPTLAGQSRTQDVECHPDWQDRFPHSVAQINVKTFLEHETSLRRRTLLESDHSSVDVRFLSVQWTSASWSKPGMGPSQSCLILATTSELDLFILGAPVNAWTGEWKLLHAISLDPIAASVQLNAIQLGDADKEVFSRSRALLRKKQLATEVICASWSKVHDPTASTQTLSSTGPQATYIVAGTRSGHIGVWRCAAISGHCTFMSATPVSSTAIEKLLVSPSMGENDANALAKIAFQDSDSVKLCDFFVIEGGASVRPSEGAPVSSDRCTITAWQWRQHQLIYSTIGRIHVYDVKTGQTTSYVLDTSTNSNSDPYSPTICISDCFDSRHSINVVRQDLREHRILSTQAEQSQSAPIHVPPIEPRRLSGYPPLTEVLQRKYDLHQAFLSYTPEPGSSLSAALTVGAIRTNERVAFLGYNVSESVCYQMEVIRCDNPDPESLVDEALQRVASGALPYPLARSILTMLYTCGQQKTFRDQLASTTENRWTALTAASEPENEQRRQSRTDQVSRQQQRQLLYLLSCRLEETSSGASSSLEALQKTHREAVLRDWLQSHSSPSAAIDERCAACESPLTLSSEGINADFGWARCQKGHVWPRCSCSMAKLDIIGHQSCAFYRVGDLLQPDVPTFGTAAFHARSRRDRFHDHPTLTLIALRSASCLIMDTYSNQQQQDIKMKFSATALVGSIAALLSCVQSAPLEKRAYVDGFDVCESPRVSQHPFVRYTF
ncbi:hypothetical protein PHSY_001031 [Pseudozyma hubeiensis SY62]|uniref:Transcription factor IIIC 90kDa subunit N-terminal domain-containing protein n=1 Tax=Pseudozyma hubeiensis (strain SY62) TaxID=1305764 RepID=R9NXX0_PSEHS|nr:hypothetical protein PHSY_001031 [Pseudozyma hubeiensis SY62]GAC93466.1 hypothetical protein PHSY_001031 [Pseudozyma hubeiensis SY62]